MITIVVELLSSLIESLLRGAFATCCGRDLSMLINPPPAKS
jgi:hypothetical protein